MRSNELVLVNFLSILDVFCTFANRSEKNNNKTGAPMDGCVTRRRVNYFKMHLTQRTRLESLNNG